MLESIKVAEKGEITLNDSEEPANLIRQGRHDDPMHGKKGKKANKK